MTTNLCGGQDQHCRCHFACGRRASSKGRVAKVPTCWDACSSLWFIRSWRQGAPSFHLERLQTDSTVCFLHALVPRVWCDEQTGHYFHRHFYIRCIIILPDRAPLLCGCMVGWQQLRKGTPESLPRQSLPLQLIWSLSDAWEDLIPRLFDNRTRVGTPRTQTTCSPENHIVRWSSMVWDLCGWWQTRVDVVVLMRW